MELDDELCLCFHVTKRKVLAFLRVNKPQRASQMSECFGAGHRLRLVPPLLEETVRSQPPRSGSCDRAARRSQYAAGRTTYVKAGKGTPPPGATPIEQ